MAETQTMKKRQLDIQERDIVEAFDVIRRYAEHQGWIPIGFRTFEVGPWTVTVNGTKVMTDHVDPYHARIVHRDIVSIMIFSPFGGVVGGWSGAEDAFIADMNAALPRLGPPESHP